MNPDFLPDDRRQAAALLASEARRHLIKQRLKEEAVGLALATLEALRTAGVVLAVLQLVGLQPARWGLVLGLFFAPGLYTAGVMVLAWIRDWRRRPRQRSK